MSLEDRWLSGMCILHVDTAISFFPPLHFPTRSSAKRSNSTQSPPSPLRALLEGDPSESDNETESRRVEGKQSRQQMWASIFDLFSQNTFIGGIRENGPSERRMERRAKVSPSRLEA